MRTLRDRFVLLLIGCFLLQAGFWSMSKNILPKLEIVPVPPGTETLKSLAFGDPEFLFRYMAFTLGNMGDTYGRSTPLFKYDMARVYLWCSNLDVLDNQSNVIPTLAAYYFAKTQHVEDARYMVDYLYEHASPQVEKKWWWLVQATYIAQHLLKDPDLALKVSLPLAEAKTIPMWGRQMPAFIHEKRGEFDDALKIMETVVKHADEIPPSELTFMRYFIEERLHKLDQVDKEVNKRLEQKKKPEGKE